MSYTQENINYDYELLTRCVEYVEGWFGINHASVLSGETGIPEKVKGVHIQIHNSLVDKDSVSDETLSAVGFRAIVSAQQPKFEVTERIVRLVPRITERVVDNG